MVQLKKIPQLVPATSVSDSDLVLLTQSNVTKKATFGLLKKYMADEFVHARDIQIRKYNGYIQWRYAGDSAWTNLVALQDLQGPQGPPGAGSSVQSTFTGDGVTKIFNGISSIFYTNALKYNVSVGGVVQEPFVAYNISLADGGSLIFEEAPPLDIPISIIAFQ